MKYLKLFENVNEWDPFGEDITPEKLKVGDKVECIRGSFDNLKWGGIYTVEDIKNEYGNMFLKLEGVTEYWLIERFKKV